MFTLPATGASRQKRSQATGCTSAKIVWMANQRARLRITPTTAAVMALRAPLGPCCLAGFQCREPHEDQRKHGQDVTQVATRPRSCRP